MQLNLTEEGVCSNASDVILIESSKQTFPNYKKDNQDLKPDDRPWIAILTKKGVARHYQLSVIDKHSALGSYKQRHKNNTRYITPDQTANFKREEKGSDYV